MFTCRWSWPCIFWLHESYSGPSEDIFLKKSFTSFFIIALNSKSMQHTSIHVSITFSTPWWCAGTSMPYELPDLASIYPGLHRSEWMLILDAQDVRLEWLDAGRNRLRSWRVSGICAVDTVIAHDTSFGMVATNGGIRCRVIAGRATVISWWVGNVFTKTSPGCLTVLMSATWLDIESGIAWWWDVTFEHDALSRVMSSLSLDGVTSTLQCIILWLCRRPSVLCECPASCCTVSRPQQPAQTHHTFTLCQNISDKCCQVGGITNTFRIF